MAALAWKFTNLVLATSATLFYSWFAADFCMNYADEQSISLDIYGSTPQKDNFKSILGNLKWSFPEKPCSTVYTGCTNVFNGNIIYLINYFPLIII